MVTAGPTSPSILLIAPRVPPTPDGVGDYTYNLGRELSAHVPTWILTSSDQVPTDERESAFRVLPLIRSWTRREILQTVIALEPAIVCVQWVPFLFSRRGASLDLPLAMLALRKRGSRVVTTVHEPFVAYETAQSLIMGPPQRVAFTLLAHASSQIVLTTGSWASAVRRTAPWRLRDTFWLPVGSNIRRGESSYETARASLGVPEGDLVVSSLKATGTGKMPDLLIAAWRELAADNSRARLILAGTTERDLLRRGIEIPFPDRVSFPGYLPAGEVSRILTASDLFIMPFLDGMSGRRTSVVSALEHGLAVVTTRGRLTEPGVFEHGEVAMAAVNDRRQFVDVVLRVARSDDERSRVGQRGRMLFDRHFSWPRIAGQFLDHTIRERTTAV